MFEMRALPRFNFLKDFRKNCNKQETHSDKSGTGFFMVVYDTVVLCKGIRIHLSHCFG